MNLLFENWRKYINEATEWNPTGDSDWQRINNAGKNLGDEGYEPKPESGTTPKELIVFSEKEIYIRRGPTHGLASHALKHLYDFDRSKFKGYIDKALNLISGMPTWLLINTGRNQSMVVSEHPVTLESPLERAENYPWILVTTLDFINDKIKNGELPLNPGEDLLKEKILDEIESDYDRILEPYTDSDNISDFESDNYTVDEIKEILLKRNEKIRFKIKQSATKKKIPVWLEKFIVVDTKTLAIYFEKPDGTPGSLYIPRNLKQVKNAEGKWVYERSNPINNLEELYLELNLAKPSPTRIMNKRVLFAFQEIMCDMGSGLCTEKIEPEPEEQTLPSEEEYPPPEEIKEINLTSDGDFKVKFKNNETEAELLKYIVYVIAKWGMEKAVKFALKWHKKIMIFLMKIHPVIFGPALLAQLVGFDVSTEEFATFVYEVITVVTEDDAKEIVNMLVAIYEEDYDKAQEIIIELIKNHIRRLKRKGCSKLPYKWIRDACTNLELFEHKQLVENRKRNIKILIKK